MTRKIKGIRFISLLLIISFLIPLAGCDSDDRSSRVRDLPSPEERVPEQAAGQIEEPDDELWDNDQEAEEGPDAEVPQVSEKEDTLPSNPPETEKPTEPSAPTAAAAATTTATAKKTTSLTSTTVAATSKESENSREKTEKKEPTGTVDRTETNKDYKYMGNRNSKKFHKVTCDSAARTKESNRVYFHTFYV